MTSVHPADVLDELVRSGQVGAVAVVRDGVVEVNHCAGTRDDAAPWTHNTLVMTYSVAKPCVALGAEWACASIAGPEWVTGDAGCDRRSGVGD